MASMSIEYSMSSMVLASEVQSIASLPVMLTYRHWYCNRAACRVQTVCVASFEASSVKP